MKMIFQVRSDVFCSIYNSTLFINTASIYIVQMELKLKLIAQYSETVDERERRSKLQKLKVRGQKWDSQNGYWVDAPRPKVPSITVMSHSTRSKSNHKLKGPVQLSQLASSVSTIRIPEDDLTPKPSNVKKRPVPKKGKEKRNSQAVLSLGRPRQNKILVVPETDKLGGNRSPDLGASPSLRNNFVKSLWEMVDEPQYNHVIRWSEDGKNIVIVNPELMESSVLSKFFKSSKFATFKRQLAYYTFSKVKSEAKEWKHELFQRGDRTMALGIPRQPLKYNETKKKRRREPLGSVPKKGNAKRSRPRRNHKEDPNNILVPKTDKVRANRIPNLSAGKKRPTQKNTQKKGNRNPKTPFGIDEAI
jgi:hypothetical protein